MGRAELEGHAQLRRVRLGELELWKAESRGGCNGQPSPVYLTGSEQGHSCAFCNPEDQTPGTYEGVGTTCVSPPDWVSRSVSHPCGQRG